MKQGYSVNYLEPTEARIEELTKIFKERGIKLVLKVWQDEIAREMGDSMIYSLAKPTDLYTAVYTPKVEYFEGGCLEVVTKNNETCIYHTEENENYICAYNLAKLGIYVKEADSDLQFSEELDNRY